MTKCTGFHCKQKERCQHFLMASAGEDQQWFLSAPCDAAGLQCPAFRAVQVDPDTGPMSPAITKE